MPARLDKKTAARAFACLTLTAVLTAAPAPGRGSTSARITSLGGSAVSGIIPDYLTDLTLNPAYAALAERTTVNYGYLHKVGMLEGLPTVNEDSWNFVTFNSTEPTYPQELTFYGLSIGSYHTALNIHWRAHNSESSDAWINQRYFGFPRSINEFLEPLYDTNNNNWYGFDFTLARRTGDNNAVGFRIGGVRSYYSDIGRYKRLSYEYRIDDDPLDLYLQSVASEDDLIDKLERYSSFFFESGLYLDDGSSEITARITRTDVAFREHRYDLGTRKRYDQGMQIEDYYYSNVERRDRRGGILWKGGLSARHTFGSGSRIFLGGSYEGGDYDSDFYSTIHSIDWDSHTDRDAKLYRERNGEGSHHRINLFAKYGKTYGPRDYLDVTPCLSSWYIRRSMNEGYPAFYRFRYLSNGEYYSMSFSEPFIAEATFNQVNLSIPVAIEFRPSSWFSLFSNVTIGVKYTNSCREINTISFGEVLGEYLPGTSYRIGGDSSYESVNTYQSAVIGCSFHLRDRFFIDLHCGSDPTPDSVDYMLIDARYAF